MDLKDVYQRIKPGIVAFIPTFQPVYDLNEPAPEFPPIIGTGFIVADGLVVTNDHVVRSINKLPKPPDCPPDVWPIVCLLLHNIPGKGMASVSMQVLGIIGIQKMEITGHYYGPPKPDFAFVHVKMKDLPILKLDYQPQRVKEGVDIATAGFPMGTDTLMAPGYLHQLTPTLQKGIISAVLPFECDYPHAFMINVMVQGGASGSPVFFPDSDFVTGILYAGLNDIGETSQPNSSNNVNNIGHTHSMQIPANISYVVPSYYLIKMMDNILKDERFKLPADTPSLKSLIENNKDVESAIRKPFKHGIWKI